MRVIGLLLPKLREVIEVSVRNYLDGDHESMSGNIRLAVIDDVNDIKCVVNAAYSHYMPIIGCKPGPMVDNYDISIGMGRVYVIECDKVIQGVLVLIMNDAELLLDNIAVAPSAQGRGLGRKMLEFAERTAVAAGCRFIRLYTNEAMVENLSLYHRIGYSETHRAEEKGLRRVYMVKPVA